MDELEGIAEGAAAVGLPAVTDAINRGLVRAGMSREVRRHAQASILGGDAARALTAKAGMSVEEMASVLAASVRPIGRSCSMFGAWGSRTVDGQLYTGRNLDWVRLDTPRCDRVAVWRACLPR